MQSLCTYVRSYIRPRVPRVQVYPVSCDQVETELIYFIQILVKIWI